MNKMKRFIYLGRILRLKVDYFANRQILSTTKKDVHKLLLLISIPFYNKSKTDDSLNKVIDTIDNLIENQNYNEAFNVINTAELKDRTNVEILWRISKILFLKAQIPNNSENAVALINEANAILDIALKDGLNCANVHKWKVIIMDMKLKYSGILYKMYNMHILKYHLEKTIELDPSDITCLFLLGTWHYELSYLTSFQRMLVNFLSREALNPNFEEALRYFESIEKLKPRKYVSNLYMLGKINFELKRYYYARYYLKIAAGMETQNEYDEKYAALARILAYEVQQYDHTYDDYVNNIK